MSQPARTLQSVAEGMRRALEQARQDERVPAQLLARMQLAWEDGMLHAR